MNNTVKIWTRHTELLGIEECLPKSAAKFLPNWWKNTPAKNVPHKNISDITLEEKIDPVFNTVKTCPALQEYLCEGIVVPMWCDVYLSAQKDGTWVWRTANAKYKWEVHEKNQFLNHSPSWVSEDINAVFKAVSPWHIQTPPGYSVYQMPLFYEFNRNYTVLPGTIHTDTHHEINQQVLFHSKEKEIIIERGTPFALYIPYKRESLNFKVMAEGEEETKARLAQEAIYNTKFTGGYRDAVGKVCPMHKIN